MRAPTVLLLSAAAVAAGLVAAAGVAAASGALRHLAVPLLTDPSLPPPPAAPAPADLAGCTARELLRAPGRVSALLPRSDGSLWVGTFDQGALVLAPSGRVERLPGLDGRESFVNALAEDGAGGVWVGTQRGAILFRGGRRAAAALAGEPVTAFARAEGTLLAGGPRGLFRLGPRGAEPITLEGKGLRVNALARAGADLFVGTPQGLAVVPVAALSGAAPIRPRVLAPVFGHPPALTDVVTALAPLGSAVVAGTDDGGLVLVTAGGSASAHRFPAGPENLVNPGAAAESNGVAAFGSQGGGFLLVQGGAEGRLAVARPAATAGWSVSALTDVPGGWIAGLHDGRVVALACPAS